MINRREFARLVGGLGLAAASQNFLASAAIAKRRAKVVIVGGGAGGATVARTLKSQARRLDVTIVETQSTYTTCFNSNHFFGGFRTFTSLQHSYDGLKKLGIKVVNETAHDVDTAKKTVTLANGTVLAYDRLVLAPGITFKWEAIDGYSPEAAEVMPHAWRAGPQTLLLMRRLEAMEDGGVVLMAVPDDPYRCPPGPYERACMIAHFLKTKKPKSKLVILDAKRTFSKQAAFEEAFSKYYDGIIDLNLTNEIDDFRVVGVDTAGMQVITASGERVKAAVANVIPPQKAGEIAHVAGCAEGDWCPIRPESFASANVKDVYVLGDAAVAAEMPKSAFSANSQAKAAAADILADLAGRDHYTARYRNTCWSLLAKDDSIKIGAAYTPADKDGKALLEPSGAFVSQPSESAETRAKNYAESVAWYQAIVADAFNEQASVGPKG